MLFNILLPVASQQVRNRKTFGRSGWFDSQNSSLLFLSNILSEGDPSSP